MGFGRKFGRGILHGWARVIAHLGDFRDPPAGLREWGWLGWAGLGWAGLGWAALAWAGLAGAGLRWVFDYFRRRLPRAGGNLICFVELSVDAAHERWEFELFRRNIDRPNSMLDFCFDFFFDLFFDLFVDAFQHLF